MVECIGTGKKTNQCNNSINIKYKSLLWCDECEKMRRQIVTKQMKNIIEYGKEKGGSRERM